MSESPSWSNLVQAMGIDGLGECLSLGWEEAAARTPESDWAFLDPAKVLVQRQALGLPDECDALLSDMVARIRSDEHLKSIAWYYHWRLYQSSHTAIPAAANLEPCLGDRQGIFYLWLALGFHPTLHRFHQRLGYPGQVTQDTLAHVKAYVDTHRKGTGRIGCYGGQVCWLRSYINSPYVRLGRLAYQMKSYESPVAFWRRTSDRRILALANGRLPVDDQGLIARKDEPCLWTTMLEQDERRATGYPVHPEGRILPEKISLDRKEWMPWLIRGDRVLSIHIPPGGKMDWPSVQDSFRQASRFFRQYHPDEPIVAFWCATWFLDPQLKGLLEQNANPLRLQRCLYLHPIEPSKDGGLWHVFLKPLEEIHSWSRQTSLEKALWDYLMSGHRWHGGGGLVPYENAMELDEDKTREWWLSPAT